jgi:UDPglucose 6-dehydrogenase
MKKIGVIGLGYVGLSNALMLSKEHHVFGYDLDSNKIKNLKQKVLPFKDTFMSDFLDSEALNITFSSDFEDLNQELDFLFIALPTNFDTDKNEFDTSIIEGVLQKISETTFKGKVVIKSTVPIGFTDRMAQLNPRLTLIFSPEFLREGQALWDNLHPSRIILGSLDSNDDELEETLKVVIENKDVKYLITTPKEAEAIKLFSNTYLAMRVAYFNEIDTFSEMMELSSENIIKGVSLDPRIGDQYNNPSFGYGGYCLPKDTKQMRSNFEEIPQNLIDAIIDSNETRKRFIADQIISQKPSVVGIYRLIMKTGSDNFRESAIFDVMKVISEAGIEIIVYEPELEKETIEFGRVVKNLDVFKSQAQIILANRIEESILDVKDKVYTRDIFHNN